MKKLRWAMDGGFWDVDASTPKSVEGVARAVPGHPLPLGLSRGPGLCRQKQIDFMQRFMAAPFVPSYAPHPSPGFSLQRVFTLPSPDSWFAAFLGQFNLQKFISSIRESTTITSSSTSRSESGRSMSNWVQTLGRHLCDKSFYAFGFCSELLLTPDDSLLLSLDTDGTHDFPRKKAVLQHKFPNHNLLAEAVWPGFFIDQSGNYWDVPLSIAIDLASVPSDSGLSYHLCMHQNSGLPKQYQSSQNCGVPTALLPGLSVRSGFSFKKNIEIWKSQANKLKTILPFDVFLSNPHISASGIIGGVATASVGENSLRSKVEDDSTASEGFRIYARGLNSAFLTDTFASLSLTAQYGSFQKLFLDLTRIHASLNFASGMKFISGTSRLAQDIYNSQHPSLDAVQTICPSASISLQQQIAGPFSFRVESGVSINTKNRDCYLGIKEPTFAVEYALQVLGSAKAVAWYSPKQQEFMIELRFFET